MALTEHLLKNISSRLKRDAAHKARNYNSSKIRPTSSGILEEMCLLIVYAHFIVVLSLRKTDQIISKCSLFRTFLPERIMKTCCAITNTFYFALKKKYLQKLKAT